MSVEFENGTGDDASTNFLQVRMLQKPNTSFITRILLKTGLIKDARHVKKVLVVIIIISILTSAFVIGRYVLDLSFTEKNRAAPGESLPPSVEKVPVELRHPNLRKKL